MRLPANGFNLANVDLERKNRNTDIDKPFSGRQNVFRHHSDKVSGVVVCSQELLGSFYSGTEIGVSLFQRRPRNLVVRAHFVTRGNSTISIGPPSPD